MSTTPAPGLIVLLGSGETSPSIRKVYNWLFEQIHERDDAIRAAILETPAGFEPNSEAVADQIRVYLQKRLQNYEPQVELVPVRKRGSDFSPDDPSLLTPMYNANLILMGPGSPTYAARQLRGSVAWDTLRACHRLGASVVFASATTIASSVHALPVYEIYKVGEELHWQNGLNFFADFGLSLIFIPHWNNNDGGDALDTSHCYVGTDRYNGLMAMLEGEHITGDFARLRGDAHGDDHREHTVVGIDENTALIVDPAAAQCRVMGPGGVTIVRGGSEKHFPNGDTFATGELGDFRLPEGDAHICDDVWQRTRKGIAEAEAERERPVEMPKEVLALVEQRQAARAAKEYARSDELRDEIAALGWQVKDTADGAEVEPLENKD